MSSDRLKELFAGRRLVIATKHKKEEVISPVLSRCLGVACITDETIDTDTLGTFTGETERCGDVLETARRKCRLGLEISRCDLAVASEGSFGPHPTLGFVNADDELLMLVDSKHKLEIVVRELSLSTNFNGRDIQTAEELSTFATHAKFPGHGLIIRKAQGDNTDMKKGITDEQTLKHTFNAFKRKYGSAFVETDMRAIYNPTRMQVIKKAAEKLAQKISSLCPDCSSPSFGITRTRPGLPCSNCGFPTRSTLYHEYECLQCHYTEAKKFPKGKIVEEPTFCDICNP